MMVPNAFGPPVETPMATTSGGTRDWKLLAGGIKRRTRLGASVAADRGAGSASSLKNCLIFGINSPRNVAIERSSEPSFEAFVT